MILDPNKIKKIRDNIFYSAKECMVSNCSQECINSHIVQESKYLKPLANKDGKLKCTNQTTTYPSKTPKFILKPTNKILSFQGFCHFHDELIFSEIEKSPIDFNNHRHLLLLNYRALCHEIRKKKNNYLLFENILKLLKEDDTDQREIFDSMAFGSLIGGKELYDVKLKMENELVNNTLNDFIFFTTTIPYTEIVASSTFNLSTRPTEVKNLTEEIEQLIFPEPLILSTIIPNSNSTQIILCTEKFNKKYLEEFVSNYSSGMNKMVNDIILQYTESWACSEKFYLDKIKPNEKRIIEIMASHGITNKITNKIDIEII